MASGGATEVSLTAIAEFSSYSPAVRHDCWAVVEIAAPSCKLESRAPIDIVAVIDTSGSMEGEKIDLVKYTLLFVINQLMQHDRFSLVTYDARAIVNFELACMTEERKAEARSSIQAMEVGTCTNLCGGLVKGMEQIAYNSGSYKAPVQSVLLLTDGLANKGFTSKDRIIQEMMQIQDPECTSKEYFEGTVYTFGFGPDHDADLLEAISTQGGGVYYFINTIEKVTESFADCLGGLLSVVGQNLCMMLDTKEDNKLCEVHTSRAVSWSIPNKRCEIHLGDLLSEERRDILLLLALSESRKEKDSILKVSLCYFNLITSTIETVACKLQVNRTGACTSPPNPIVDQQRNRTFVTAALKEAKDLADEGNLKGAESLIIQTIAKVEGSESSQCALSKSLLNDLRTSCETLRSHDEYNFHGKQYILSRVQSHVTQRCNFVELQSYYTNHRKEACKKFLKHFTL